MYLHALATAVPPHRYTQTECWEMLERSQLRDRLKPRSLDLIQKILLNDRYIATRHFALPDIGNVFDLSADELNQAFQREAPKLAGAALTRALDQAGLKPTAIDALLICTCTGYLCPGLTSYVSEQLGLRPNAILEDFVGLGCGAAIPTLRAVSHILAAHPEATVACVAVETCSAAFYLDDDFGVIISACLFGDGAAASLWRSTPGPTGLRAFEFNTRIVPGDRDLLRFESRGGKLRNLLHKSVPHKAAAVVTQLYAEKSPRGVEAVLAHPGGRDVIAALVAALPGQTLDASTRVLREYGNMSSPSVLFVLADHLQHSGLPPAESDLWLVSFGAGFSAHSCRLGIG